jgi:hypothetical protein
MTLNDVNSLLIVAARGLFVPEVEGLWLTDQALVNRE